MFGCGTETVDLRTGSNGFRDVELLHRVPEPVAHVQVLAVVGEEHVGREREPVLGPEHLLEVVDAVAVVVVGQPDRARARAR